MIEAFDVLKSISISVALVTFIVFGFIIYASVTHLISITLDNQPRDQKDLSVQYITPIINITNSLKDHPSTRGFKATFLPLTQLDVVDHRSEITFDYILHYANYVLVRRTWHESYSYDGYIGTTHDHVQHLTYILKAIIRSPALLDYRIDVRQEQITFDAYTRAYYVYYMQSV